tara:strand:- start:1751 stop:2578 length:828 start_codon:yes stop_codon:yes gene_type:complete
MKKCCTILLQRNLPDITNKIGDKIIKNSSHLTDFYVVESGSDDDKLSKFKNNTFHANWPEAKRMGLRTGRGFNYGLSELEKLGKKYKYYFMITGDTVFETDDFVNVLVSEMEKHGKMGILSPLSRGWTEFKGMWGSNRTMACTLIPHVSWIVRRELIEVIGKDYNKDYMGYLYDGENFRCYDADTEILVKCYNNNFFPAVTSKVFMTEDSFLTDRNVDVMKTERRELHRKLMWDEGMAWLKKKYGFDGKIPMRNLLNNSCANFFKRNQDLIGVVT